MTIDSRTIRSIARDCGFELCGVASAEPPADFARFESWTAEGHAGDMRYLTDRRAEIRRDVRNLLAEAKSVICVGKLYNQRGSPAPPGCAVISRYAWGSDYHEILRAGLEKMVERLQEHARFEWKICVDTAPLLERTFARLAGLGWIGKNTCLINEPLGSWFFLGELITSLDLAPDSPPPDRCGTCTRCIDACPTRAFVPAGDSWAIDARRCIAYFTIELRGSIPEEFRAPMGMHVFGCDICQEVCPWNSRAPVTDSFEDVHHAPALEACAAMTEEEFREAFRHTALARPKYAGFLRNVAVAMGNSGLPRFRQSLERLAAHPDATVAEHARWALARIQESSTYSR
ncbi:MAG TPA: tRNA epoxyqueuosine(34) reductase QueG [Bryobacteraceae bacterium]|nr:tRNA epoxyqueuosine(34) reductase QueG [Bryobacteraceae bacterium]